MEEKLKKVLKYFSLFAYHPTLDEIYTFFPEKISKKSLKHTPVEYKIRRKILNIKYQISKKKLNNWRYRAYIGLLALFPQIKLIGLSGSISMMNANLDDDIDLFIITKKDRLFTGRFLATIFAYIMGLKRGLGQYKAPNKVCLNLFFDEKNLAVPKHKQTIYVGHEVLQMKPIIVKGNIYQEFLEANKWVTSFFPNAAGLISKVKNQKSKIQVKSQNYLNLKNFLIFNLIFNFSLLTFNFVESILKDLQLSLIDRHRTTETITNSQLWFHPDDFEKKIKV